MRAGEIVLTRVEVSARRRARGRLFPAGTRGRVVLPPERGYVVLAFDAEGGDWLADVPTRDVSSTREVAA